VGSPCIEQREDNAPWGAILEISAALGESGNGRTADTETQQHEKQQGEDERTDDPRGRPEETLYITQPESINPERVDEIHSAASARSAERSPSGVRSRPDSSPRSRSPFSSAAFASRSVSELPVSERQTSSRLGLSRSTVVLSVPVSSARRPI